MYDLGSENLGGGGGEVGGGSLGKKRAHLAADMFVIGAHSLEEAWPFTVLCLGSQ